jgi:uncharacterized surface protein with fasciclin (FAS1) repeats
MSVVGRARHEQRDESERRGRMRARDEVRASVLKRSIAALVLIVALPGCGLFGDDEGVDVAAAHEQFCSDVQQYVEALGEYGGLFEDVAVTVGDVKNAAQELEPGRDTVVESWQVFQEAVEADPTSGVDIDLVEPESIEAVEAAEQAFADASDVRDSTTVVDAGVGFTSAAYQLEVAWVRLFADAGCIEDEAQASQWVSDYVSALQADLSAAGYYTGTIDGLYGPDTIAAVVQLQQDADLPETGLLDPATQTALAAILARGTSAQVGALQGILISTGYYDGAVDGVWSPALEQALKDLQGDLGVPATGVVDAATLRAFERALEEAGQAPVTTTAPPGPTTTEAAGTTTTQAAEPTTTQAPPATTAPPTSDGILQVLAGNGQFGEFLAAIEAAGLTDMLSGPGPFTVFAPTDEAFAAAGDLPTDPEALSALVLHHVVEGAVSGFDLQGLSSVTTSQGSDLAVSVDQGQIVLDGISTITVSNVVGGNGLAHAVNAVLVLPG